MVVRATRTVFNELELGFILRPMIIPWAKRVKITSAEDDIAYNDGITGSHFAVGGIDLIIIPRHVSSLITEASRLSIGIVRGNPGVFQLYPYPYPPKPLPLLWVRVLGGKGRGFLKMYL